MRMEFWKRWAAGLVGGVRRFPMGLVAAAAAAGAAIWLNHKRQWGLGEAGEGHALRVLLLWAPAVFGNVAWRLRCERDGRAPGWGLAVLGVLLIGGWFLLPARPQDTLDGFWFGYGAAVAACLAAALVVPARRAGEPALWDAGWSVLLAAFMATLAAMIAAGGVNAALFSVEKLFGLKINERVYFDVVCAGFFLAGPVTAFAWLPHPFGAAQEQPAWVKGAARVLLAPLCLLYALILYAYIGKIALAARWPDGWVAMPTLIFAAVGLAGYLIARTARDRAGERWSAGFGRAFPVVLLPLAVVLLMAMRVRIAAYGFTEWRAAGVLLGVWILGYALAFTVRPSLSSWWIGSTLAALSIVAAAGPVWISRRSQADRLERRIAALGVWEQAEGAELAVDRAEWDNLRSIVDYLLRHHGPGALPAPVSERWTRWRAERHQPPVASAGRRRRMYGEAAQVLTALGIAGRDVSDRRWVQFRCDGTPFDLHAWPEAIPLAVGVAESKPFRLDHSLQLWAKDQPVASPEREAFLDHLEEQVQKTAGSEAQLPPDRMGYAFRHAGRDYRIQFWRLYRQQGRRGARAPEVYNTDGYGLLFLGPQPAP